MRKYDVNGNEVWTRQFGTGSYEVAVEVAGDASTIYVVGLTGGSLPSQTSSGDFDAFLRKYDASGNELWTRQFGTTSLDQITSVSADPSGIYVAGDTGSILPGQTSAGGTDAFVRKYDVNGNELWTRQFGTADHDSASGILAHASGIYVVGRMGAALPDAFVRKYDVDGNELWTRQFGTAGVDIAEEASADDSGVYVTGYTDGTLPGQANAGGLDPFVRKYDFNGNEVWTRQFGTANYDDSFDGFADASGVYVAGRTEGTLPGQASAGGTDGYVRKYNPNGNEVWTLQFGTAALDVANRVSSDGSGIYVAGNTGGTLPGQTSGGDFDVFAAKLVAASPTQLIQQLIAQLDALNLKPGIATSLIRKLDAALRALNDQQEGNDRAAINLLQAFINSVEAQRGVHINNADADALIAAAQAILAQGGL